MKRGRECLAKSLCFILILKNLRRTNYLLWYGPQQEMYILLQNSQRSEFVEMWAIGRCYTSNIR